MKITIQQAMKLAIEKRAMHVSFPEIEEFDEKTVEKLYSDFERIAADETISERESYEMLVAAISRYNMNLE